MRFSLAKQGRGGEGREERERSQKEMLPGCVRVLKAVVQGRKQHQPLNVLLQRSEFQDS